MTPTPHAVVTACAPAVTAMLVAKATALVLREEVDAIQARLLTERAYTSQYDGKAITEPKWTWLMGDDDSAHYLTRLAEETLLAGHVVPEGYCPALMAEHALSDAENAVISASEPFFKATNHQLLCGTKDKGGLETRREFLDLIAGLCVNYPGVA